MVGIFVRFFNLNTYVFFDEAPNIISGIKFYHQTMKDGANYVAEHPPLARFLMGISSIFISSDYSTLKYFATTNYSQLFYGFEAIRDNFVWMRVISALAGSLTIFFIFLIGKRINFSTGIWSAVLIALSMDFIFYSRWASMEVFMLLFGVVTIYFYLKFLDKNKIIFLVLTALFLLFHLSTRAFNPMFLMPSLVLSHFLIKKKFDKEFFSLVFIAAVVFSIFYFVVWPPQNSGTLLKLKENYITSFFGLSLPDVVSSIFFRNSYLFLFAIFSSLAILICKYKFIPNLLREKSERKNCIFMCLAYFLVSFSVFSIIDISVYGAYFNLVRYTIILYIPLAIFCGWGLSKICENKIILLFLVFLILVNFYSIFISFPNHIQGYSNFGFEKYSGSVSDAKLIEDEIAFLKEKGEPEVITNQLNILLFYEKSERLPSFAIKEECNQQNLNKILKTKKYIIYRFIDESVNADFFSENNVCILVSNLNLIKIKSYSNNAIFEIDDSLDEKDVEKLSNIMKELESHENPFILTNNDKLISIYFKDASNFYALPLLNKNSSFCKDSGLVETIKSLGLNKILVYDTIKYKGINEDDIVCKIWFENSSLKEIKTIDGFKIYEIGS